MIETKQSLIPLPYELNPSKTLDVIKGEVQKHWEQGWIFVKAEPDALIESVCLHFKRDVLVPQA